MAEQKKTLDEIFGIDRLTARAKNPARSLEEIFGVSKERPDTEGLVHSEEPVEVPAIKPPQPEFTGQGNRVFREEEFLTEKRRGDAAAYAATGGKPGDWMRNQPEYHDMLNAGMSRQQADYYMTQQLIHPERDIIGNAATADGNGMVLPSGEVLRRTTDRQDVLHDIDTYFDKTVLPRVDAAQREADQRYDTKLAERYAPKDGSWWSAIKAAVRNTPPAGAASASAIIEQAGEARRERGPAKIVEQVLAGLDPAEANAYIESHLTDDPEFAAAAARLQEAAPAVGDIADAEVEKMRAALTPTQRRRYDKAVEAEQKRLAAEQEAFGKAAAAAWQRQAKKLQQGVAERLVEEMARRNMPKDELEAFARTALDASVPGMMMEWAAGSVAGEDGGMHGRIMRRAMEKFDPSFATRVGGEVAGLLLGSPVFSAGGAVGKAGAAGIRKLAERSVMKRLAGRGVQEGAEGIARRVAASNAAVRLGQAATASGATLGVYDAVSTPLAIAASGSEPTGKDVAWAAGRGVATGMLLPVIGMGAGRAAEAAGSRLGRHAAELGGFAAENAAFVGMGTLAEGLRNGEWGTPEDLAEAFAHSVGVLGIMKSIGALKKAREKNPGFYDRVLAETEFTPEEVQELDRFGIDGKSYKRAIYDLLSTRQSAEGRKVAERAAGIVSDKYRDIMQSDVSMSLKSKLLYLVEGRIPARVPLTTDVRRTTEEDGRITVELLDPAENLVQRRTFTTVEAAEKFEKQSEGLRQINTIQYYENQLDEQRARTALEAAAKTYAAEQGMGAESVQAEVEKAVLGKPHDAALVAQVVERARPIREGYEDVPALMADGIVLKYGLGDGGLERALARKESARTAQERAAVAEYASRLKDFATPEAPVAPPERQLMQAVEEKLATVKNRDDEAIYTVMMGDGREANIIKGTHLVYDPETGEVDTAQSDPTVVVRYDDGTMRQVSVRDIDMIVEVMNENDAREEALQVIRAQLDAAAREDTLARTAEQGGLVALRDGRTGAVEAMNEDGTFTVAVQNSEGQIVTEQVAAEDIAGPVEEDAADAEPPAETATNPPTEATADPLVGRSLTDEEAAQVVVQMEAAAVPAPELELTPENWVAQFGEDGMVETPIGEVKMGENQYLKLLKKRRQSTFGMIKPTLEIPDVILEESDPQDGAERDTKYLFIKTFVKSEGSRYVHFESVTVRKDNLEVSVSSHEIDKKPFIKKMQNDRVLHLGKSLFGSEGRLTEPHTEGPDLVPTPETFDNKDTTYVPDSQEAGTDIPRLKNGLPDFNAMPAEMLAMELSGAVGHDKAVERLLVAREANTKNIEKLRKALAGIGDLNKAMAAEQQLAALRQEDTRLTEALDQLGASDSPAADTQASAGNFTQEIERLFPDGLPNVRAQVLADIARGQRFVWNDSADASKRGMATELGFRDNESERRNRIGILGSEQTGAKHVSRYVHDLWEDSNGYALDMDDAELRNEVIDVLLGTPSRAAAMEQLRDMAARRDEDVTAPRDVEEAAAMQAYEEQKALLRKENNGIFAEGENQPERYGTAAEKSGRNNDGGRETNGSGVSGAGSAGGISGIGDRGDIRVFEEGMAAPHPQYSEYSERNRQEAESERLVKTQEYGAEKSERNNGRRFPGTTHYGSRMADDATGGVARAGDRGDIRVFEEGMAPSYNEHSEYSERNRREKESERLVAVAKANGLYFDAKESSRLGQKYSQRTGESVVYFDKEKSRVYKVKNPYAKAAIKGNAPEDAIFEHIVHNLLFPEAPYRFEGISEDLGDVRIILSQDFVDTYGQPTKQQIEAALAERGLLSDGRYSYGNDLVSVTDVEGNNVLLGHDGRLYFIDPIIKLKKPAREVIEALEGPASKPERQPEGGGNDQAAKEGETVGWLDRDAAFSVVEKTTAVPKGITPKRWAVITNQLRRTIGAENVVTDPDAVRAAYERIKDHGADLRQQITEVNARFNRQLEKLTPENADSTILDLGMPSAEMLAVGIAAKPLRLYGNKLLKKAEKHGYAPSDIRNLPEALEHPVAIFKGSYNGSFAILTELSIGENNVLASVDVNKGAEININIITSVYGKEYPRIIRWIKQGRLLYADKTKALDYLIPPAPMAGDPSNIGLSATVVNIVTNFENPKIGPENIRPEKAETRYFQTPSGEVYGFTAGGKIYLDGARMNAATPMHEYTELWAQIVAREQPELWERGVQLLKSTEVWKQVGTDSNYEALSEELRASETLARITAALFDERQAMIGDDIGLFDKLRDWLREFWKALKATFSKWTHSDLEHLSEEDFARMPLRDFVEGVDLRQYTREVNDQFSKEKKLIQEKAQADGTYLTAPNGKPSHLTADQWETVRTRQFKAWFGDWEDEPEEASKMVDENGEPKIFYHGSNATQPFYAFDIDKSGTGNDAGWLGRGIYFSGDRNFAKNYARGNLDLFECFLNIRDPYFASFEENERLAELDDVKESAAFTQRVREEGYDGVYYNGDLDQEAVVYDPEQIKTAMGNSGAFDPSNPDIRYSLIGEAGVNRAQETAVGHDNQPAASETPEDRGPEFTERQVTTLERLENMQAALLADRENIANFDEQLADADARIEAYMHSDPVAETYGEMENVAGSDAHLRAVEDAVFDYQRRMNMGDCQMTVTRDASDFAAKCEQIGHSREEVIDSSGKTARGFCIGNQIVIRSDAMRSKREVLETVLHERAHYLTNTLLPGAELYEAGNRIGIEYINRTLRKRSVSYTVDPNDPASIADAVGEMISRDIDILTRDGLMSDFLADETTSSERMSEYMQAHRVPEALIALVLEQSENIKADIYGKQRTRGPQPAFRLFREGETGEPFDYLRSTDERQRRQDNGLGNLRHNRNGAVAAVSGRGNERGGSPQEGGGTAGNVEAEAAQTANNNSVQFEERYGTERTTQNSTGKVETPHHSRLFSAVESNDSTDAASRGVDGSGREIAGGSVEHGGEGISGGGNGHLGGGRRRNLNTSFSSNSEDAPKPRGRNLTEEALFQELTIEQQLVADLRRAVREAKASTQAVAQIVSRRVRKEFGRELVEVMGKREFDGIIRQIEQATMKQEVEKPLQRIAEVVLDLEIKRLQDRIGKYLQLKVEGKGPRGISVAKEVDDRTRRMLENFRQNLDRPAAELLEELRESPDADFFNDLDTVNLLESYQEAERYRREVEKIAQEQTALRTRNTQLRRERIAANKVGHKQLFELLKKQILFNKSLIDAMDAERIETKEHIAGYLKETAEMLSNRIEYGREILDEWRQQEEERRKGIVNTAFEDAADGSKVPVLDKQPGVWERGYRRTMDFLLAPAYSMDYLLKMISVNAPKGEGALYDHFMRGKDGYVEARGRYWLGYEDFKRELDEKAREVFGKSYPEVVADSNMPSRAEISITNGKVFEKFVPTIGEAMYICMADKMTDGRVKLRRMGISEEDIDALAEILPQPFLDFANWLQHTFLPRRREAYNATHLAVFGAQMARIENYVPLRIQKSNIHQEVNGAEPDPDTLPSAITGSIIKRVRNNKVLNLHTNALDLMLEHGQQMEHWNAFTRVVLDMNALLSSTSFRRMLEARNPGLHKRLKVAAQLAADSYRPQTNDVNRAWIALGKLAATSKIAFRVNTALKQVLSYPAFYAYAPDSKFWAHLTKNLLPTTWGNNWRWCMDNIPSFRQRWLGRMAGNEKLAQMTAPALDKWLDGMNKYGMLPNAFVDALTCANGAKAVYDFRRRQYIDRGVEPAEAERLARIDAAVAINATQQSSEGMFIGQLQADRDFWSVSLSTFQNSNFAYLRKQLEGIDELFRDTKREQANRAEYYKEQGLSEDEAFERALKEVVEAKRGAWVNIGVFVFLLNVLWGLGNNVWKYLFAPETRDEIPGELAKSALVSAIRNTTVGSIADSFAGGHDANPSVLLSDMVAFTKRVKRIVETEQPDAWNETAAYLALQTLTANGLGIDLESFVNLYQGIAGMIRDGYDVEDLMRTLNAPQSQAKLIAGKPREGESWEAYRERMIFTERRIASRLGKKRLDKWSRNYKAYRQAEAMGLSAVRDKLGRVTVPELETLETSYVAALKDAGLTTAGDLRAEVEWQQLTKEQQEQWRRRAREVWKIDELSKQLDTVVVFDAHYVERMRQLMTLEREFVEEVANNKQ